MNRLQDKIAIITGGNSGIGEAAAKIFAQEGATVVIAARRQAELDRVVGEVTAAGGKIAAWATDVSKQESVEALFKFVIDTYGRVDILVNNAGILDKILAPAIAEDALIHEVINTNAMGAEHCIREALKSMLPAGKGTIVTVASIGGALGHGGAGYSMSKGAAIALTKSVAIRYGLEGIRANALCPGGVKTPMNCKENFVGADYDMIKAIVRQEAGGAFTASTAEEQANIILFLASDESAVVNGQVIVADKGATL